MRMKNGNLTANLAETLYDVLQPKERWVQEQAMQTAEERAAEQRVQKMKEAERLGPKQTNKERESRIQASVEQQRDQARERRRNQAQESRVRSQASLQEGPKDNEETLTLDLLVEMAHTGERYCVCQKPYNSREYYIHCLT